MLQISQISTTTRFACWDLFITAQIAVLYCSDWHAEISATIHNYPHWNRRVFRTWRYRAGITTFMIWERTVSRGSGNLREEPMSWRSGRDLVVADVGERKGLRSSPRGQMWDQNKAQGSLSSGLNVISGQGSRHSRRSWMWARGKARPLFSGLNVISGQCPRLSPRGRM